MSGSLRHDLVFTVGVEREREDPPFAGSVLTTSLNTEQRGFTCCQEGPKSLPFPHTVLCTDSSQPAWPRLSWQCVAILFTRDSALKQTASYPESSALLGQKSMRLYSVSFQNQAHSLAWLTVSLPRLSRNCTRYCRVHWRSNCDGQNRHTCFRLGRGPDTHC